MVRVRLRIRRVTSVFETHLEDRKEGQKTWFSNHVDKENRVSEVLGVVWTGKSVCTSFLLVRSREWTTCECFETRVRVFGHIHVMENRYVNVDK